MPLSAWTCDTCGTEIDDPHTGLLTWQEDAHHKAYDFRLVHKNIGAKTCDPGAASGYVSNVDLVHYLGPVGQAALLSMLSIGPLAGPSELDPRVKDFDSFVDVYRRLQTPWYEEARSRFTEENVQNLLSDANEYYPYMPEVLERIAKGKLGR